MWKFTFVSFLIVCLLVACGGDESPTPTSAGAVQAPAGATQTPAGATTAGPASAQPTPTKAASVGMKLFPSPAARVETGGLGVDRPRLLDFDETPRSVYLIALHEGDGWAALIDFGGRSEVRLFLPGITESAQAHIHSGGCQGAPEHELPDVAAGTSIANLDVSLEDLLTGGFWIDVHPSQSPQGEVECSAIPGADSVVTFEVNEANESGLSGWATIYGDAESSRVVVYLNPGKYEPRPVQIREMACAPELLDAEDMGASLGPRRHNLGFMMEGLSRSTLGVPFKDLSVGDLAIIPGTPTGRVTALACGEVP